MPFRSFNMTNQTARSETCLAYEAAKLPMLDAITATRARRLLGERLSSPHMKKDRALGLTCSKICDGVRIPPRAVHKEPRRASLAQAKLAAAMLPRLRAGFTTGLREGEVGSSRHAGALAKAREVPLETSNNWCELHRVSQGV